MSASRLQVSIPRVHSSRRGVLLCRAGVGLFFSTSTGHTEDVAGLIKEVRLLYVNQSYNTLYPPIVGSSHPMRDVSLCMSLHPINHCL